MDKSTISRLARRLCAAMDQTPPSERSRQVFEQVRLQGRRQTDVAAELGISQGRVAQICRSVEQWARRVASPASQGPEQFRKLADLICELAYLRQVAEEKGAVPRSANRLEVVLHALRAIATSTSNIKPARSSGDCGPGDPLSSESASEADYTTADVGGTCDEAAGTRQR